MSAQGIALLLILALALLPALPQRALAATPAGNGQSSVILADHCGEMALVQGAAGGMHKAGKASAPARCPMDATCLLMHGALPPANGASPLAEPALLPSAMAVKPLAGVSPPTLTGPPRLFA
jgi:hypothetical protein